jgi:hypothetical protein
LDTTVETAVVCAAATKFIHKKYQTTKSALIFPFWRAPAVPQHILSAITKKKALEIDWRFQGLVGCGSQI